MKRLFSGCVVAVLASLLSTVSPAVSVDAPGGPAAVASGDRPNVVYVLVDDMRADDLAFMPKTVRLVGEAGMTFTEAISPHPLCCPARAEILTGQYAQNNGVQHNDGLYGGYPAFDPSETIATWLDDAGYQTAFHGKYLNAYQSDTRDPGWDVWDPLTKNVYGYTNFGFYNGDWFTDDYVTTRLATRSNQTIRKFAETGDPFYVQIDHLAPHAARGPKGGPALVPPVPEEKYAHLFADRIATPLTSRSFNEKNISDKPSNLQWGKRNPAHIQRLWLARIRSLQSVDDAMESLYATLRETGELDNTYVVFTSDNGYALGEHRYEKKNRLSREILSVPLLVAGPAVVRGASSDRVATLVDVAATVVDVTGVSPTLTPDGSSLRSHLSGETGLSIRDTTLVQTGEVGRAGDLFPGWAYRGVQTDRYLFAYDVNAPGNVLLYDRANDPYEMRNAADDPTYVAVRAELWRRTQILMGCSGWSCNQTFGPLARIPTRQ